MEVEEGGEPPRVHSIDDYFMVEDGEDDDDSSSSARGGGRGGSRPGGKRTAAAAEKQAPVYKYDAKMEGGCRPGRGKQRTYVRVMVAAGLQGCKVHTFPGDDLHDGVGTGSS